jgi:hypothetical protein
MGGESGDYAIEQRLDLSPVPRRHPVSGDQG